MTISVYNWKQSSPNKPYYKVGFGPTQILNGIIAYSRYVGSFAIRFENYFSHPMEFSCVLFFSKNTPVQIMFSEIDC